MRKVIYKEWVRGGEIISEEYKQWKKSWSAPLADTSSPQLYVDGTNCYIEKEGLFMDSSQAAMENNMAAWKLH